ncbi:MAG: helicase-related protein [Thermomicrobiales bacterium]
MSDVMSGESTENADTLTAARDYLRALTNCPDATFQDGQWEAIAALVNHRRRVLVVQRTGWGKTAVYFIATKLLREAGCGPTLIISPLVALMRNQAAAGRAAGLRVGALNADTASRFPDFVHAIRTNTLDALIVAPEQLGSDRFREHILPLLTARMGLLAIDEAHCISEWGHDFRPDYQRIRPLIARLPPTVAVLATTATANARVLTDLRQVMGEPVTITGPLHRDNLGLHVLPAMATHERLAWLADFLSDCEGSTIVYALRVQDADLIAAWLHNVGLPAVAYHGDRSQQERRQIEAQFERGEIRTVVATSALSLGYHNALVQNVIHADAPNSPLAYYQEVGRAGRHSGRALGILVQAGNEDAAFHRRSRESAMPPYDLALRILLTMARHESSTPELLATDLNEPASAIEDTLRLLSVQTPATVVRERHRWYRTAIPFNGVAYDRTYHERLAIREAEWEQMVAYREQRERCRMAVLIADFAPMPESFRCGLCDVCLGISPILRPLDPALIRHAGAFLHGIRPVDIVLPTRDGVRLRGKAVTLYGESRFGAMVKRAKYDGERDPELIRLACLLLSSGDWPAPSPTWVTAVPSRRDPEFVAWVATGIADQLGVPFQAAVQKTRDTDPQKFQMHRAQQRENVRDVFAIVGEIPAGPALVVDDMVDSGETLAEICSLLRAHGCEHAHPFALATSASRRTR